MSTGRLPRAGRRAQHVLLSLGVAVLPGLAAFGGCTTENPRELFARAGSSARPLPGTGGSGATGATGATGGATQRGGSGGTGPGSSDAGSGADGGAPDGSAGHGERGGGTGRGGNGPLGTGGNGATGNEPGEGGNPGAGGGGEPEPTDTCGEPPVSSEPFTKLALRAAAADCAVHHYCKFEAVAARFDAAAKAQADDPSEAHLEAARTAWRAAMAKWSEVELFQFGPVSPRAESAGRDNVQGLGIRDFVYAWPLSTRCRVEEQIASRSYRTLGFENVLVSSRGLFALEYLLFYPGSDTACAGTTATATSWATLSEGEIAARKREYLGAVSGDVLANVRRLLELWSPSGGNFRDQLVNLGGYGSEQESLNIIGWSLLYVEREVKDWKLGIPAGYTQTAPVNGPEAPFAHVASENVRGNLRGFRGLFQGCGSGGAGLGFDDWLTEAGHGALAADIVAALDVAEATAASFPELDAATPAELESFYRAVKALTDLLKNDLFGAGSPLNLKMPASIGSDTD